MRRQYVYQYCVIDAQGEVHMGLTTAESRAQIIEDLGGNYGECRFMDVHPLPSLEPEIEYGQFTGRVRPRTQVKMW
jgi:hypothetical protein